MTGSVTISKANKEFGTYQFNNGEFYRVLEPGLYDFYVKTADGKSYKFDATVQADEIKSSSNYRVL
jgi:hypothetical protein